MKIEEKILTREQVKTLGLDKVSVITADMLNGFTCIGNEAFYYCTNLASIEISNSITSIGNYAFYYCTGLSFVMIPNSVTSIGAWAFADCTGLTSITIPNSVEIIKDDAFCYCTGLTSPVYNAHVFAYMPTSYSGTYSIPEGIESIIGGAFLDCTGLTSVTIPNSVTSIGNSAFRCCTGLTSITIGNKTYKKQTITHGKCKAYKGFNADMTCRDFQYKEGKTYELKGEPILCEQGFHACLSLSDVFNYYWGELGKNIVVHEVELEHVSDECNKYYESKIVAKKITISKRIL